MSQPSLLVLGVACSALLVGRPVDTELVCNKDERGLGCKAHVVDVIRGCHSCAPPGC